MRERGPLCHVCEQNKETGEVKKSKAIPKRSADLTVKDLNERYPRYHYWAEEAHPTTEVPA